MKRGLIIKLVIFLLLGAIVNVGVAWGCTLWTEPARQRPSEAAYSRTTSITTRWDRNRPSGYPANPTGYQLLRNIGVSYWSAYGESRSSYWYVSAGWPFRTLGGGVWRRRGFLESRPQEHGRTDETFQAARQINKGDYPILLVRSSRLVPLRPIFPGFLVNTLFYGVIV